MIEDTTTIVLFAIAAFFAVYGIANYVAFRFVWRKEIREHNERHADKV